MGRQGARHPPGDPQPACRAAAAPCPPPPPPWSAGSQPCWRGRALVEGSPAGLTSCTWSSRNKMWKATAKPIMMSSMKNRSGGEERGWGGGEGRGSRLAHVERAWTSEAHVESLRGQPAGSRGTTKAQPKGGHAATLPHAWPHRWRWPAPPPSPPPGRQSACWQTRGKSTAACKCAGQGKAGINDVPGVRPGGDASSRARSGGSSAVARQLPPLPTGTPSAPRRPTGTGAGCTAGCRRWTGSRC